MSGECDKCGEHTLECKCITQYINKMYAESYILFSEDQLLMALKMRQEELPSDKNDKEWEHFSDFVIKRRTGKLE